jgi:hypothetical protein
MQDDFRSLLTEPVPAGLPRQLKNQPRAVLS